MTSRELATNMATPIDGLVMALHTIVTPMAALQEVL